MAVAVAAGLALADASVVVLALPPILTELDAEVASVAAVIGAYTLAVALALPIVTRWRSAGPARLGAAGMAGFALASAGCGLAGALEPLIVFRALQGVAAAAVLVAAFDLLQVPAGGAGRRAWLAAAVVGTAIGPALGGALTQLLDWRAIFLVQVPVVGAAAWLCWRARGDRPAPVSADRIAPEGDGESAPAAPGARRSPFARDAEGAWVLAVCLGLLAAALIGVLFLLVLLLVSGWALSPLAAAAVVSVVPAAALAGTRVPGDDGTRAVVGCVLVAGGVAALAFLAADSVAMTLVPQAAAGVGMGMALTAFAGGLLPERTAADAARLLAVRHAGITLALAVLAPVAAAQLESATDSVQLRGTALVLDAELPPLAKLELVGLATAELDAVAPRAELSDSLERARDEVVADEDDATAYRELGRRLDETLVARVDRAFVPAFLICGAFGILAALGVLAVAGPRLDQAAAAACLAAVLLIPAMALVRIPIAPPAVELADPCDSRDPPSSGGLDGLLQEGALRVLDQVACEVGSSREELALGLVDDDRARAYEAEYGVDPQDAGELAGHGAGALGGLLLEQLVGD